MNYFETITKFLPSAVDAYFVAESKSVILENGSKYIDVNFNEAGYVKIADVLLDGLSDYYKTQENPRPANPAGYAAYAGNLGDGQRDGLDIGGTAVRWEIFKLQWCRGRQFRIDHISNEETAKILTGQLIKQFHELKVIPEVDACRFGVIADSASTSLGNLVSEVPGTDITESNVLAKFFAARKWLVDHEVPLDELVWFVSPEIYTMLMNSDKLTKFITQSDYRSESGITFEIKKFNDVPIIEVPSSRFFTHVLTTRNGFQAQATSKPINYMMCSKRAIIPIRKLEWEKMYDEDMAGLAGYYGIMFNYLLYHGVVIPRNKLVGTFVSVGTAGAATNNTNVLAVDIREGSVSNAWMLKAYFTMPSGLRGTVMFSRSKFEIGGSYSEGDAVAAVAGNALAENAPGAAGVTYYTRASSSAGEGYLNDGTYAYTKVNTIPETHAANTYFPLTNVGKDAIAAVDLDGQVVSADDDQLYFGLIDFRGVCIAATPNKVTLVKKSA